MQTAINPIAERISSISVSSTMKVAADAEKLRAEGVDVVDFGAGEPDFPTPDNIKQAAVRALEQNFTKYTPAGGTAELKKAVCESHARDFGTDYKPSECMITVGGKHVIFKIAPNVFALYVHLHTGSIAVKVGDVVKAGTRLASIGNTGPSMGPHLHFGLSDKPNFFSGRALPFVLDGFAKVGVIDFDASEGDHVVMAPDSRQVGSGYPLYGSVVNFP